MRSSRVTLLVIHFSLAAPISLIALIAPAPSRCQGTPWYTIPLPIPNGFVDASTGTLHFEIPFGSMPQRTGEPIVSKMVYDLNHYSYDTFSQLWMPQGPGWLAIVGDSQGPLNATRQAQIATFRLSSSECNNVEDQINRYDHDERNDQQHLA